MMAAYLKEVWLVRFTVFGYIRQQCGVSICLALGLMWCSTLPFLYHHNANSDETVLV